MNAYDAIMRAADYIERNPRFYNFKSYAVPGGLECVACMWGWVGHFLGLSAGELNCTVAEQVQGDYFTGRLYELAGPDEKALLNHKTAAEVLRLYAAKYHAPRKPDTGFRDFMQKAMPQYREKAHAET